MNSSSHLPSERLRPFIKHYLIIDSAANRVNRVLPGTSLALAFRYLGETSYVGDSAKYRTLLKM